MAYTDSLCPDCLRAVQTSAYPTEDSLVLLGIDTIERAGLPAIVSRHYACIRCMATWKATPIASGTARDDNLLDWQLIDSPS